MILLNGKFVSHRKLTGTLGNRTDEQNTHSFIWTGRAAN